MEQSNRTDKMNADILECKVQIEDFKKKYAEAKENLRGYEEFRDVLQTEKQKVIDIDRELSIEEEEIGKMCETIKTTQEKYHEEENSLQAVIKRRLDIMKYLSIDAANTWEFYSNNRNKFKSEIYVPIMDITLKSADAAMLIENSTKSRDWIMFICLDMEDMWLINDSSFAWRVSSTIIRPEKIKMDQVNASIPSSLQEMGFKYFVSEAFDAPAPLKQFLCNVYQLHELPVGEKTVDENMQEVTQKMAGSQYQTFITASVKKISVSKYAGEIIDYQEELKPPEYWSDLCFTKPAVATFSGLLTEIDELQECVDRRTKELHKRKAELQNLQDKLKNETSIWRDRKWIEVNTKNSLDSAYKRLDFLERQEIDVTDIDDDIQEENSSEPQAGEDHLDDIMHDLQLSDINKTS